MLFGCFTCALVVSVFGNSVVTISRRHDIEAPILVDVISPKPFSEVYSTDFLEISVSGLEIGEGKGALQIKAANHQRLFTKTKIAISEFDIISSVLVGFEISAAEADGTHFFLPGSVAYVTVWLLPTNTSSDVTQWGISAEELVELRSNPPIIDPSIQPVFGLEWTYPNPSGFEALGLDGLVSCFAVSSNSDAIYLAIIPNPTKAELENMPHMFQRVNARNPHKLTRTIGYHTLSQSRWRVIEGINILYIWASSTPHKFDMVATVTFVGVSDGDLPLMKAFASKNMYDFVSRQGVALPAFSPAVVGAGGLAEERRRKILIVTEIPPRGLDRTGDEHAVGVVVNASKSLGFEIEIVSRICEWSNTARTAEQEEAAKSKMDPYIRERMHCPVALEHASGWLSSQSETEWVAVVIMSRVWDVPNLRGLPDVWIPLIKSRTAARVLMWGLDVHFACSEGDYYLEGHKDAVSKKYSQISTVAWADAVVTYTPEEASFLSGFAPPWVKLFHASQSHGIPLSGREVVAGFESRRGVILFGAAHIINIEANLWFICRVWPILRRKLAAAKFENQILITVVGMTNLQAAKYAEQLGYNMTEASTADVRWLGYVENLDEIFGSARICATPILSCPEFCSKNMRSLERGLPVVTTERGARGYFVEDDHSGRLGIAVAAVHAAEFAEVAFSVMTRQETWEQASRGALELMRTHFQEAHAIASFADAIRAIIDE